eukprot:COSAG01_NODE_40929_length_457_cov_104.385475_1_plen_113_part_01
MTPRAMKVLMTLANMTTVARAGIEVLQAYGIAAAAAAAAAATAVATRAARHPDTRSVLRNAIVDVRRRDQPSAAAHRSLLSRSPRFGATAHPRPPARISCSWRHGCTKPRLRR